MEPVVLVYLDIWAELFCFEIEECLIYAPKKASLYRCHQWAADMQM